MEIRIYSGVNIEGVCTQVEVGKKGTATGRQVVKDSHSSHIRH